MGGAFEGMKGDDDQVDIFGGCFLDTGAWKTLEEREKDDQIQVLVVVWEGA